MRHGANIDTSLMERRGILELIERLRCDGITIQEMEQIGTRFRQAGRRALRPLVRELWRESSGELIAKYAFILDFFDTESWLDQLIQIAVKRRDLGDDGKAALLIALEGYGVDLSTPALQGAFARKNNPLGDAVQGALRLGEEGIVTFLDDFLSYSPEAQMVVIRELSQGGDPQGARVLEALLWHDDPVIVRAALTGLGTIRDAGAAGVLVRYIEGGNPELMELARKSLRRLLFLGVRPPPPRETLPFHQAYATPPDGDGYRSLLVSRWMTKGGLTVLYMQMHERRGLLAAWGAEGLTGEGFGAELEGFRVQDDLHEVPPGYLLDLLRDALYWSRDLCYLPADFYMRRGMFAGYDLEPALYRPTFGGSESGRGLSYREGEEITRELFADPFFAGWFMAGERVHELAGEYRSEGTREEVLERFCAELLVPDLEVIRERLLMIADLMRRCGRNKTVVARVVALAGTLLGSPLPHHLHPFLRFFAKESMEIARDAQERGVQTGEHPAEKTT